MSSFYVSLVLLFCGDAAPQKTSTLQYVRPSGDKQVLESEISETKLRDGHSYQSITHRATGRMTLTILYDKKKQVISARAHYKTKTESSSARAVVREKHVSIFRGDKKIRTFKLSKPVVVVTTAPDWSDIILLLRQYDQKKGGKQSFLGLWFHPTKPAHLRNFVVEKIGNRIVKHPSTRIHLGKFRVTLRSGAYEVWADKKGIVHRIGKPNQTKGAIVLRQSGN